jgi:hypothetical protein
MVNATETNQNGNRRGEGRRHEKKGERMFAIALFVLGILVGALRGIFSLILVGAVICSSVLLANLGHGVAAAIAAMLSTSVILGAGFVSGMLGSAIWRPNQWNETPQKHPLGSPNNRSQPDALQ